MPPYLAGRQEEQEEFSRLLDQHVVLENAILTGLRGVGKTVLLEIFKPLAQRKKWLWVGTDLSESASVTESTLATRLLTDVAVVASSFETLSESESGTIEQPLDYDFLLQQCDLTPGLISDKLKSMLEIVHAHMPKKYAGIIFAYDEAQNLSDHAVVNEYPLSVLLEVFQSIQRKGIPFMLLLTGLPTLFPKLVEARTYAERMFRVLFLTQLSDSESDEAIRMPMDVSSCAIRFTEESIELIKNVSGGYPYFIQFICREVFDLFLQQYVLLDRAPQVQMSAILKKLDSDFFAGRWARATDRQRDLLSVAAMLEDHSEFSVKDIVESSKVRQDVKGFSSSHSSQMLATLADTGLIYKNRYGKYSFAVPLLAEFIRRQSLR